MTEELITKAREAGSAEELLALMQENGMEDFTSEDAEELYAQLHMTGELTDEELENVSGGKVTVGGQKYKVVTNCRNCFTGKYQSGYTAKDMKTGQYVWPLRDDHKTLREIWSQGTDLNMCGSCIHLGFTKALTGYCEVEHSA